jgi:cation-dependent mannose-6-phosphate receptor
MHRPNPWTTLLLFAAAAGASAASKREPDKATPVSSTKTAVATPCVATHSTTGSFFDLRPDIAAAVKEGEKHHKGVPTEDYTWARPAEWPNNFTMNICAPVVEGVADVVGVDKKLWQNISAYYEADDKIYSLGYAIPFPLSRLNAVSADN